MEPKRLLRAAEVASRTGYSIGQIWRLEREGKFPKRVLLNEGGTRVAWIEDEINEWIEARPRGFAKPVRPPINTPAVAQPVRRKRAIL